MPAPEVPQTVETSSVGSSEKKSPLAFVLVGIFGLLFVIILTLLVLDVGGVRTSLMVGALGFPEPQRGPVVTTREIETVPAPAEYENPFSEESAVSAETPGYANPFGEEEYANPFEGMEEEYVNPFEN